MSELALLALRTNRRGPWRDGIWRLVAFCGLGVREGVWACARICVFIPPERKLAGLAGGGGVRGRVILESLCPYVRAAAGGDAVVASVATCSRLNCGDV